MPAAIRLTLTLVPLAELIVFTLVAGAIGLGNAIVIQLCASALGVHARNIVRTRREPAHGKLTVPCPRT